MTGSASSGGSHGVPRGSPRCEVRQERRAAGGRWRTTTSKSGRVTSASSGTIASIVPTGSSPRLAAKIVTAGYCERTIRVAG